MFCFFFDLLCIVKPIYGILSDSLLFYGLQRAPYISFAGGIGIFCFGALAAFKMPIIAAAVCIFGGNLSMSSPDVMIDAIVAQQCKFFPRFASVSCRLCIIVCIVPHYLLSM